MKVRTLFAVGAVALACLLWVRSFQEQGYSTMRQWFRARTQAAATCAVVAVMAATHACVSSAGAGAAGASGGGASRAG